MLHSPQRLDAGAASAATAARLRGWLLSDQVQQQQGQHAGGVAGALDADGHARYVYPEITGYFLHWLAEARIPAGLDAARVAAARATDWTLRQFANGAVPQTRSYLVDAEHDWRNDAAFFFDLAMLLRGLCAASDARLIAPPFATLQCIVNELQRFVSPDGEIHAARALRAGAQLPTRWSTIGGAFEVKASSRVMLAARYLALPQNLVDACESLADRYLESPARMALDMLHPTLYFAEGMLVARPQTAPEIGVLLRRCLDLQHADGSLPEADRGSAVPRSDIIAQTLRIGLLLHSNSVDNAPHADALHKLAAALVERVDESGRIAFVQDSFVPDSQRAQPNIWCGMFAEQALRWHAGWCNGQRPPSAEWLV